jgi:hypothetical protein
VRAPWGGDAPDLGRYCTSRPSSAHLPSVPTCTTFSRTCCISSSKSFRPGHHQGNSGPCRLSTALAAIRAAAARVGGFSLLAVLVYVADEHPAIEAGTWPLEASVVNLYGVVVIRGRWARVGCAKLCGVHSAPPLWAGLRGVAAPAGPFLYPCSHLTIVVKRCQVL